MSGEAPMEAFPGMGAVVSAIFVAFAVTTVAGAVIAANSKRVIRGVCGLAMCCVGLAGLFYFLHSPFLALMELLIYVGAVCVTIVFVIMLAEPEEAASEEPRRHTILGTLFAVVIAGAVFVGLAQLGGHAAVLDRPMAQGDGSVNAIGISLLTTYSAAFELISLVLLVAILGALAIARTGRTKP